MINILNIFLCGGEGKRLWPLSREHYPKQFLKLINNQSLLINSIKRFENLKKYYNSSRSVIVSNNEYRYILENELKSSGLKLNNFDFLYEPYSKNTAPAILSSILHLSNQSNDPILIISPTDHHYTNNSYFEKAIKEAVVQANNGYICTIGIKPSKPETGYGYIKIKKRSNSSSRSLDINSFIEKPSFEKAKKFVASNSYFWNAGIFIFKLSVIKEHLNKFDEKLVDQISDSYKNCISNEKNIFLLNEEKYKKIKPISFDYEFMEKIFMKQINSKVIPLPEGTWSDLGSFESLFDIYKKDKFNNSISGNVISNDSKDNLIISDDKLVILSGVNKMKIINTPEVLFIKSNFIRENTDKTTMALKTQLNSLKFLKSKKVHRVWGWYDVLSFGESYKVKHIYVYPKKSLSLQSHKKRSEHWVVFSGKAKVYNQGEEKVIKKNESVFIQKNKKHKLSNPFSIPLEIIEVQTGTYLEEDDIKRYD